MRLLLVGLCALSLLGEAQADAKSLEALHKRMLDLNTKVDSLIRQTMLQTLGLEESGRGEGDSGVKQVATEYTGTKTYMTSSLANNRIYPAGLAPNSFNKNKYFITSMQASLNGVDFKLPGIYGQMTQPSLNSKIYTGVNRITMPPVPPAVLQKKTVEEQTVEMLEWFKAFRDNNYKTRDFRRYFRPIVCYLEGWYENIPEGSFKYNGMYGYKEIMYQAISGLRRSHWPRYSVSRQIWDSIKGTTTFAEWKTRVLCQPIKMALLKTNRFILVDDLSTRMMMNLKLEDYKYSNLARFTLNPVDSDRFNDKAYRTGLLDKVMASVPGLDNHVGKLTDSAFDIPVIEYDSSNTAKNTAFYHRFYKVQRPGAMGQQVRHRGFSDSSIFMAQTSQPNVAQRNVEDCKYVNRIKVCKTYVHKFSYAVPLMVMYLNPLHSWNPHKLPLFKSRAEQLSQGRNGGNSASKAYTGYTGDECSTIPSTFFEPKSREWLKFAMVNGTPQRVGGCGHRWNIQPRGLGKMRLGFPIFPTNHEGSAVMKETAALQDMVLDEAKFKSLWRN